MRLASECTSLHRPIKIAAMYVPKQALSRRPTELEKSAEGPKDMEMEKKCMYIYIYVYIKYLYIYLCIY